MTVLTVLFLLLLLYKPEYCRDSFYDSLSIGNSYSPRGICALFVVVHHLSQNAWRPTGLTGFFSGIGYLAVAVFFFYCGFGLVKSYLTKKDYRKTFLSRRVLAVLIPYTAFILVTLLEIYLDGSLFSGFTAIYNNVICRSWYILVTLLFYLLFYLLTGLFPDSPKKILWGLFLGGWLWIGLCPILGLDTYWYNTCLCIVMGGFAAQYEKKLIPYIHRRYKVLVTAALTLFGALLWTSHLFLHNAVTRFLFTGAVSLLFAAAVQLVMMKFRSRNPLWSFLSKLSLEIYLFQMAIMHLLQCCLAPIGSETLWAVLTVAVSIVAALGLHPLFVKLWSLFQKSHATPAA